MDLGLQGKRAIVCASSKGLGFACAKALAREGASLVMNGRHPDALNRAAAALREEVPGADIKTVVGDVTSEGVRTALVEASGEPDILVNNAGGPPPGDFRKWSREAWIAALDANLLSAVELIRLVIDGMVRKKFGRIVNITSSTVRVPIPVLGLSNAARAGLTNFVFGLAPSVSSSGVTINNLLPGPFDTDRLRNSKEITRHLTSNPVAGRVGDPDELGAACAFLCGRQAGYITGQNLLMDGGLYPGNF
jgi:3-oxoacyl-[acyl-carrier protein] reductase